MVMKIHYCEKIHHFVEMGSAHQINYEKDEKETVESMAFIVILNIDIKEVKAKNLDVTYEFDPSLDSSSELGLKSVFCSDFTSH